MNAMMQVQNTSHALVPQSMDEAMRVADFMSNASLIPTHLQGKPGDCLLVVMQSQRWGMDALSVAQCTSVVHGKLCYEGKLVSAVLMSMGVIKEELDYEFSGTGKARKVVVTGVLRNGKVKTVEGTIAQWETSNDAWRRDPDQMLTYRGARQWARRWAPSAMLGVYTPDEMEDVPGEAITVKQQDGASGLTPRSKSEKAAQAEPATQQAPAAQEGEVTDAEFTERHDSAAPAAAAETPAPQGDAKWDIADGPKRIILIKASAVGLDEAAVLAKFGTITQARVNEVLGTLTKMASGQ